MQATLKFRSFTAAAPASRRATVMRAQAQPAHDGKINVMGIHKVGWNEQLHLATEVRGKRL